MALLSPLEEMAHALASAHMVQHLLLILVAAPLLSKAIRFTLPDLVSPPLAWLLHTATIWFWHAAVPYDAALDNHLVHVAEHASYVVTGL